MLKNLKANLGVKPKTLKRLSCTSWFHSTVLSSWHDFCDNGIVVTRNQFWSSALDFGYGFYLTDTAEKAQEYFEWGKQKGLIDEPSGLILEFEFIPLNYVDNCKIFENYDKEYAQFVLNNRAYNERGRNQHSYDWVYGQMCDNKPTEIIEKLKSGILKESEAIDELLVQSSSFKQLSIHSQEIASTMRLRKALRLDLDDGVLITQELNTDEYNRNRQIELIC